MKVSRRRSGERGAVRGEMEIRDLKFEISEGLACRKRGETRGDCGVLNERWTAGEWRDIRVLKLEISEDEEEGVSRGRGGSPRRLDCGGAEGEGFE